jgi:sterol desaturase/sphingolipid hydroxylase (fatty acid hydroxylase superfamily)
MNATEIVLGAIRSSYFDFFLNIPLVIVGIVLAGALFYFLLQKPERESASFTGFLRYLFPKENYSGSSARVDFWVWVLNGLFFVPLFAITVAIASLILGVSFHERLVALFGPGPQFVTATWAIIAVQFFGNYLGFGIGQYGGHLAHHKIPVLWALHRAHHSTETANFFAFFRSHPLENFINGATRVIGAAVGIGLAIYVSGGELLPGTTAALFWYQVGYVIIGFRSVDHTHIPLRYGNEPLDVLLGAPIMHQVHHSAEVRHRDINMGGAGYIYDWMFGTLYLPKKGETWRWGLNEDELGENNPHPTLKAFFVEPVVTMGRELRQLVRPLRGAGGRTRSKAPS